MWTQGRVKEWCKLCSDCSRGRSVKISQDYWPPLASPDKGHHHLSSWCLSFYTYESSSLPLLTHLPSPLYQQLDQLTWNSPHLSTSSATGTLSPSHYLLSCWQPQWSDATLPHAMYSPHCSQTDLWKHKSDLVTHPGRHPQWHLITPRMESKFLTTPAAFPTLPLPLSAAAILTFQLFHVHSKCLANNNKGSPFRMLYSLIHNWSLRATTWHGPVLAPSFTLSFVPG